MDPLHVCCVLLWTHGCAVVTSGRTKDLVLCTAARAAFHGLTQLSEIQETDERRDKMSEKLMCKGKVILHAVHFSHER